MPMNPRLLRPRAGTGFSPKSISSLLGWWDAQDAASVTLDGSNVTAWADKSGLGQSFTQGTGAAQPVISETGFQGRRALSFTGSRWMTLGSTTVGGHTLLAESGNPFSVYAVVFTDTSATSAVRTIIAKAGGSAALRQFQLGYVHTTLAQAVTIRGNSANANTDAPTNTYGLAAVRYSGSAADRRFNNATDSQNVGSAAAETENITIGIRTESAPSQIMLGLIGEILIYGRYVTASEEAALFRYFNSRWGLAVT